jgi:Asp-tRNA(Asn)/Glu-tRNA(Gln) amidotransferase A subunit family amidase
MGTTDDGLPLGFQICAAAGKEAAAVSLARLYQSRTHWHQDRPPGFA